MLMPCTICKQLILFLTPASVTECGHLFHEICVNKWFEDKATCPQCRVRLYGKPFRVKFNAVEQYEDGDVESRFEQLMEIWQSYKAEVESLRKKNVDSQSRLSCMLRTSLDLDKKLMLSKSEISTLKKEYRQLKVKLEKAKKLKEENEYLKKRIELLTKVDKVINGNDCEMYEMLERIPVTQITVQELCTMILAMKNKIKIIDESGKRKQLQADALMQEIDKELASLKEAKQNKSVSDKSVQTECLEEELQYIDI